MVISKYCIEIIVFSVPRWEGEYSFFTQILAFGSLIASLKMPYFWPDAESVVTFSSCFLIAVGKQQ